MAMEEEEAPAAAAAERWSRIPFDILQGWEDEEGAARQKKRRSLAAAEWSRGRRRMTGIGDVPEAILAIIFSLVADTRSRNCMALACSAWYSLERATRSALCLRGNVAELHVLPRSFQAVVRLDLPQCSPWGYSLFQFIPERAPLVGHVLKQAFPRVSHLTIYARDARDIAMVARFWPELLSLKLVRWHQRPTHPQEASGLGMEFRSLMLSCQALLHLDLSQFYCWTEDIPLALQIQPAVSRNLRSLNLLKPSPMEGFKASELGAIAAACANLEELRIGLVFDPRFLDFVGDDALLQLATSCKKLRVLHLIDGFAFTDARIRGDPNDGFDSQDAQLSRQGLSRVFEALPLLEDLAFVLSQNVTDAGPALETLASRCKKLRSLRLGHFHGVCKGPQPDGLALCLGLEDLVIKNSADLDDIGVIAIAARCTKLAKFGLQSCKGVSKVGLRSLTSLLSQTLVDVEVFCSLLMNAVDTLWALQPIQTTIQHLHLDCIWDADLIARESERIHMGQGIATSNVPELNLLRKENEGFLTPTAPYGTIGKGKDGNPARGRMGDSLDLNFSVRGTEDEPLGSLTALPIRKLKDGSCGGWLTLSSSAGSSSEEVGLNVGIDQDSLSVVSAGLELITGGASQADPGNLWQLECAKNETLCSTLNSKGDNRGNGTLEHASVMPITDRVTVDPTLESFASEPESFNTLEESVSPEFSLSFREQVWSKLKSLSLWIPLGELLSPLMLMGLKFCPSLQEIKLKVEGDSRFFPKPKARSLGIATFVDYPALSKLVLDCSEVLGYALSAPVGHMELSSWERWYLQGIQALSLWELDYWPPQDPDANRRGLSLPAAGLISQCQSLRKLVVHGSINEHLLKMFLNIPNLRDVQLRIDYYPAPEVELNTEMRTDACKRFEAALTKRGFPE